MGLQLQKETPLTLRNYSKPCILHKNIKTQTLHPPNYQGSPAGALRRLFAIFDWPGFGFGGPPKVDETGVFGDLCDLSVIYPKSYSSYLRGTRCDSFFVWGQGTSESRISPGLWDLTRSIPKRQTFNRINRTESLEESVCNALVRNRSGAL